MSDAKTAAIEAAKAAVASAPLPQSLIGPDGKLSPTALALAVCGIGALMLIGCADVFYVDGRGVTRHVRHTQWAWKKRSYAITGDVDDENRSVMDPTGEIDKIVGERIYAEVEKTMDAKWRAEKMATRKPIPESEQKHMAMPSGDDRTLCGDAFDRGDSERRKDPEATNPVVAKKHEPITCEACLRIIRACRDVAPWRVV